jgi:hypothetical protein
MSLGQPLRVLMIEDSERDAELAARKVERAGYDVTSKSEFETAEAMKDALQGGS